MRPLLGLGLLALVLYGVHRWRQDVREGEQQAAFRARQRSAAEAMLEGLALL